MSSNEESKKVVDVVKVGEEIVSKYKAKIYEDIGEGYHVLVKSEDICIDIQDVRLDFAHETRRENLS